MARLPLALTLAFLTTLTALAGCVKDKADPVVLPPPAPATSNLGGAAGKSVTSVFPGTYNFTGPYSRVLAPGTLPLKQPERVSIPSPIDGSDIEMGLHLPVADGPVPIMVFASPYMDAEESITRGAGLLAGAAPTTIAPSSAVKNIIANLVPHGYGVVTLSVRGTGGSDGCNDLMGPNEVADLDAALTWIGEQPWSTGAIAMTGVSYDGSTPWSAASTGNPYLKTIIPISGVPDIYGLMYRNGSSEARGPVLLNALYVQGGIDSGEATAAPGRLCPEAIEGVALSAVAGVLGTDPTGYWQARNRKPNVEANYKGSVFSVQGLQDWNVDPSQVVPWVDQLEAKGIRTKQLLGQWEHSWPDNIGSDGSGMDCPNGNPAVDVCNRADYFEILLRWLDQELKGLDVDTGAPVQVSDSLGRWRNEENYPPHDATWTTYYLTGNFLSLEEGPRSTAILYPQVAPGVPPSPPPNVDLGVKGAAAFYLAAQQEDMLIAGLPKVHVTVTPAGPGGYIGAYLYSVAPSGEETRIGWTTMNLAYADGGTERRETMPGETIEAMMEIQPMDAVIPAGHQLLLRVWVYTESSGTNAGPVTVPADVQMRIPTIPPGPVSLEMGTGVESILILPTIVRNDSVYFSPPKP